MMASSTRFRDIALGALSLSSCFVSTVIAQKNYTQFDMMRAQLALLDDRPSDCPPWLVFTVNIESSVLLFMLF